MLYLLIFSEVKDHFPVLFYASMNEYFPGRVFLGF